MTTQPDKPRHLAEPGRPLARTTMTFASPAEPTAAVTIELVVTDDIVEMPHWHDLPEAQQAGWIAHEVGNLILAYRIIA